MGSTGSTKSMYRQSCLLIQKWKAPRTFIIIDIVREKNG